MNSRSFWVPTAAVLVLGFAFLATPGRGQEAPSVRTAFADTTLLRDTLNLKFDLLFPLADSLQISPGLLRSLSIRYRIPLLRIVHLSDSLRMPVDSVGAVMERESFNPLIMGNQRLSAFSYNSSYQIGQEGRATWGNETEYTLSLGGIHARNVTRISFDRARGSLLAIARVSETETNYRYSKNFSTGARVYLQRDEGYDASGRSVVSSNEFQVTMRSSQQPSRAMRSGLNLFLGPFTEPGASGETGKRGLSSKATGTFNYNHRGWLIYDLNSGLTARLGRARLADQPWLNLREFFGNARGTLALYERSPVSVRISHDYTRNRAQTPDTSRAGDADGTLQYFLRPIPSGGAGASVALQVGRGSHGSMTITGDARQSERLLKVGGISRTSRTGDASINASARYTFFGWSLDGRFTNGHPYNEDPLRITTPLIWDPDGDSRPDTTTVLIDYRQKTTTHTRSFDITVERALTRKLSVLGKARIYLSSPRSAIVDSSYRSQPAVVANPDNTSLRAFPSEPRENYDDSIELQGIYSQSQRFSTSIDFEISTRDNINLLSSKSINNTHARTYRTQWSWTYRLMPGLTATQRNQVTADYTYFPFAGINNLLVMRFDVRTTLNAVITPRFRVDLSHGSEEAPRGSYVAGADGQPFFRIASRTRNYNLTSNISYAPFPSMSINLTPTYRADTSPGSPNASRSLNFAGGANVNLPVGERGSLSGNMSRTYSIRYAALGENQPPGVYSWSGSLQFSWRLE
jgi:hypothetical protein